MKHVIADIKNTPVQVFGINLYTDIVIDLFEVVAVIDDFSNLQNFKSRPVLKRASADKNIPVINCAGGQILTTQSLLKKDFKRVIHFAEILSEGSLLSCDLRFNEDFAAIYKKEKTRFESVRRSFSDVQSRLLFDKVINFRKSYDIDYLEGLEDLQSQQYFEPFIFLDESSVFYDVGCFDGFTALEFMRLAGEEAPVVYFEPNKRNLKKIRKNLGSGPNIFEQNVGLSNDDGEAFITDNGSESTANPHYGVPIKLAKLDSLSGFPAPSFVKLDIEGHEVPALEGMANTLSNYQPCLAVACYHYPRQMIEVFEAINMLGIYKKVSFRHYTESIYESVLFFYN